MTQILSLVLMFGGLRLVFQASGLMFGALGLMFLASGLILGAHVWSVRTRV